MVKCYIRSCKKCNIVPQDVIIKLGKILLNVPKTAAVLYVEKHCITFIATFNVTFGLIVFVL